MTGYSHLLNFWAHKNDTGMVYDLSCNSESSADVTSLATTTNKHILKQLYSHHRTNNALNLSSCKFLVKKRFFLGKEDLDKMK